MARQIRSVTVYCSSSEEVAAEYIAAGAELGRAIAENKWTLIYGGNSLGTMKATADAARGHGGRVVGITPKLFVDHGHDDKFCDELLVTEDMRERKQLLEERGDALIALPGGLGTLEELIESITRKVLRLHDKPIVLINLRKFFDPFLDMIERGIEQRFIKPRARETFFVTADVPAAIGYLQSSSDHYA